MSTVSTDLRALRRSVSDLHAELVRYSLVAWTAGNVSARLPGQDLLVIKYREARALVIAPALREGLTTASAEAAGPSASCRG